MAFIPFLWYLAPVQGPQLEVALVALKSGLHRLLEFRLYTPMHLRTSVFLYATTDSSAVA